MNKLLKFLKILDDNIVKILLIGFIFLVPLWPKLPIRIIDYTYIAIRLEDIYLAFMTIIFFIQLLRRKFTLNKLYLLLFSIFWVAVFASSIWGIYVGKTIIFPHLGLLHALRRVEYMIVFFIAAASIKNKKDFFHLLGAYFLATFFVVVYGLGQKFLNFPAVQTMNPEYAKGYILYLTPEARISATFAGHYDLASYIVFTIPFILSFYFYSKKKRYLLLFVVSLVTLVYTASRISFGAYIVATFGLLFLIRKYLFAIFVFILTGLLMFKTGDLTQRFLKTVQIKRILINEKTGAVYIGQIITTKELPAGSFYLKLKDQTSTENLDAFKLGVVQNELNKATASGLNKKDTKALEASLSANIKPINTVLSDISFATRLQVEWPRAINAFKKNPILGTGPSSITEATDNDYLRWIGEFGIFGTSAFFVILFIITKTIFLKSKKVIISEKVIFYGYLFGFLALLINATYIDVFEASKVAYTFWMITGLFIGYVDLNKHE